MKFGFRIPSLRKSFAARTSFRRVLRHSFGFKAPRGMGIITNPRKAVYNRIYRRTTFGVTDIFPKRRRLSGQGRVPSQRFAIKQNSGALQPDAETQRSQSFPKAIGSQFLNGIAELMVQLVLIFCAVLVRALFLAMLVSFVWIFINPNLVLTFYSVLLLPVLIGVAIWKWEDGKPSPKLFPKRRVVAPNAATKPTRDKRYMRWSKSDWEGWQKEQEQRRLNTEIRDRPQDCGLWTAEERDSWEKEEWLRLIKEDWKRK